LALLPVCPGSLSAPSAAKERPSHPTLRFCSRFSYSSISLPLQFHLRESAREQHDVSLDQQIMSNTERMRREQPCRAHPNGLAGAALCVDCPGAVRACGEQQQKQQQQRSSCNCQVNFNPHNDKQGLAMPPLRDAPVRAPAQKKLSCLSRLLAAAVTPQSTRNKEVKQ